MTDAKTYLEMQRRFYDALADTPEAIVGGYDFQENFPYETLLLFRHGDIRRPLVSDIGIRRAFDIGCGEGRMIRRMQKLFARVDGGDVSEKMVGAARERCPESTIWLTRGDDCGDAPSDAYDFCYCTISLHHIASYTVRKGILRDVVRILKPDGSATIQLLFSEPFPFVSGRIRNVVKNRHIDFLVEVFTRNHKDAGYFEDRFDAAGTNSDCDAVIGTRDIPAVIKDFQQFFEQVSVWLWDISIGRGGGADDRELPMEHPNSHLYDTWPGTHFIFIHGRRPKKPGLGNVLRRALTGQGKPARPGG